MSRVPPNAVHVDDDVFIIAETDEFIVTALSGKMFVLEVREAGDDEYVEPDGRPAVMPRAEWIELMVETAYNAQDIEALKAALAGLPPELQNPRLWLVKMRGKLTRAHNEARARLLTQAAAKIPAEGFAFPSLEIEGNLIRDDGETVTISSADGKRPARFSPAGLLRCALYVLADRRMQQDSADQYAPFILAFLPPPTKAAPATPDLRPRSVPVPAAAPAVKVATPLPAPPVQRAVATEPKATPLSAPAVVRAHPPRLTPTVVQPPESPRTAALPVPAVPDPGSPHRVWVSTARARFRGIVADALAAVQ